jgi:hypothetical protein
MKSSKIFKQIFLGEYVEVLIKLAENDTSPVMQINGFFLDIDNDYYYLGNEPDAVSNCIAKKDVGFIHIRQPNNPALDLLNRLPTSGTENAN